MNRQQREVVRRYVLCLALIVCGTSMSAAAQSDTIRRNPNAVKLTRIWSKQGTIEGQREVGRQVEALGDINRDGICDFAIQRRDSFDVFLGGRPGPSATPLFSVRYTEALLSSRWAPLVGDIFADGAPAYALAYGNDLVIYRDLSTDLPDSPAAFLRRHQSSTLQWFFGDVASADLDGDGADELIVARTSTRENNVPDYHAHILIYRGGPDLSLDASDAVIRDNEPNTGVLVRMAVDDVDGDRFDDIVIVSRYRDQGSKLKVWFGNGRIDGFASVPDRSAFNTSFDLHVMDVDGDRVGDVLIDEGLLFRSGSGKDLRTRSYALDDADARFLGDGFSAIDLGPLNDSTGRYAMIGKLPRVLHAYSGGPQGPDLAWDAWYYATADGFTSDDWDQVHAPLGDVNGDGWHDIAFGNRAYPGGLNYGIAVILSGGAYIPRDSFPPSAIRDVADDYHRDAFTLWPLPARDVVNVAWRGDLASFPVRYVVVDALGRLVADGEIGTGASSMQWRCGESSAGVYVVTLLDAANRIILSETVIRE
jgi:hypothetical protein